VLIFELKLRSREFIGKQTWAEIEQLVGKFINIKIYRTAKIGMITYR